MKKLIGALALATIAFGFAFADANVNINYRTQASLYEGYAAYNGAKDKEKYEFKSELLNQGGIGGAADNVKFSIAGEACGVTFTIIPQATGTALNKLNEYSGWIKIAGVEFGMGSWKDGKYDGSFQLKNDADASNLDGGYMAAYKLGNMAGGDTYQIDNVVGIYEKEQLSAYAQWIGNLGKVKTTLIGALVNAGATYETGFNSKSSFGLRGTFAFQKTTMQVVVKSKQEYGLVAGLHFLFKPSKTTSIVLGTATKVDLSENGYAMRDDGSDNYKAPIFSEEWNIDFRLRYADGPFSFSWWNNFSHIDKESAFKSYMGGLKTGNYNNKTAKFTNGMWNMLAIRYKINDTVTFLAQVGQQSPLDKSNWEKYGMQLMVNPGVQIYANSSASITLGVAWTAGGLGQDKDKGTIGHKDGRVIHDITVPCYVRVKL